MLDRVATERGELVLRRDGRHLEVISNGVFLMDTRDGRSERQLVRAALDARPAAGRILIGGLGAGFSLREAVADPGLRRIDVVECESRIVAWHQTHFADLTGEALSDPRVHVVVADVRDHLASNRGRYDVVCLDVDNGPDWTVSEGNAALYLPAGLQLSVSALVTGGVLAVWSAHASEWFERLLHRHLEEVRVIKVPASLPRGAPDVLYLGRRRDAGNQPEHSGVTAP